MPYVREESGQHSEQLLAKHLKLCGGQNERKWPPSNTQSTCKNIDKEPNVSSS